jgi:pimeloyl-ACP methyl ester carboxylesterase
MRSLHTVAANSGMVLVRVDKPGLSDSEGSCKECDYLTEISAYKNALEQIRKLPYVDANSIYLMGESLGGATAALVAQGEKVKGLIAISTVARPWYDHMMANERRRLALMGKSPGEIEQYMARSEEFYTHYLKDKMTPAQIVAKKPHLKGFWDDEPNHQYGRPLAFYQQLQSQDVRGAFQQVKVPTLVIWGEYDWIMAKEDSEWIVNTINKHKNKLATLRVIPKMEHSQGLYNNAIDAFNETDRIGLAEVGEVVVNWIVNQKK